MSGSAFDDYVAETLAGMRQGAADIGRSAVADIGDSYQEILMSHASVSPADGLTGTLQTVTTEADLAPEPQPEPVLPPPEIDVT